MKKKSIAVLAATIISIAGIYLVNSGITPLKQTGEVASDSDVINYALPPGFVFSIWGVIYLGFLVYAIYSTRASGQQDPIMQQTANPYIASILLNLLWVVIVGLTLWVPAYFVQWLMLGISIYLLKKWGPADAARSGLQKWMAIPFALYAGWLTVAMIPFTADLLNLIGWRGGPLSQETWGAIIYVVAVILVVWAYTGLRQPFYLLPLAWALFGLYTRFDGLPAQVAIVLCVLLLLFFFVQAIQVYKNQRPVIARA